MSLGAIESIILIGCLHKMRSHLAEDPSFQSLTRKIHGSSMDFPSERGKKCRHGHVRVRGQRAEVFGLAMLGWIVLWCIAAVCLCHLDQRSGKSPLCQVGPGELDIDPKLTQNPHISMRENDDHPWVYGIAGILVEAFPLRCSTCSTCPEGSPNRRSNFALSTMQLAKSLVVLKYGYPQVTMGFNAEMV